jgi:hypothetical protein
MVATKKCALRVQLSIMLGGRDAVGSRKITGFALERLSIRQDKIMHMGRGNDAS